MPEETKELIKSIKEVFLTTDNNFTFNIPEYQRGYKWTDKDVELLLNDVMKFHDKNYNDDEFYCLQNITLVKNGDMYNVVDGQQRLTTVYIILSYIKSRIEDESFNILNDKLLYSIEHKDSENNSCKELIRNKLLTNDFWQNFVFNLKDIKSKDEYYILQVADKVKEWFETNLLDSEKFNRYINTFENRVKFIVNEVEGNEETIFANLNGGKVPLDGADLIRAIIITKAAKEKFENPDKERINEYRVRLGMELDSINRWWEDSDVQNFYKLLLPQALIKTPSFDFKKYPINYLYAIYFIINKKDEIKDLSLDFFETGVNHDSDTSNDHFEMYKDIVQLHYVLKDWYEDFKIYHLLGYLFRNFKNKLYINEELESNDQKNKNDKITLKNIYELWDKCCKSKNEFISYLKILIKKNLISTLCKNDNDFDIAFEELKNAILNTKMNWYDYDLTIPLLSLLDVIYALNSERKERIPLTYLSCGPEDKEHINPQADKEKLGECENSIGNIVLLDRSVNRSYKDDSFDRKLNRIISEYFANKAYIRLFTFNVFLQKIKKSKSETGSFEETTWTEHDVKENTKEIVKKLEKFFKEM